MFGCYDVNNLPKSHKAKKSLHRFGWSNLSPTLYLPLIFAILILSNCLSLTVVFAIPKIFAITLIISVIAEFSLPSS